MRNELSRFEGVRVRACLTHSLQTHQQLISSPPIKKINTGEDRRQEEHRQIS